jgi:hypothetical protein
MIGILRDFTALLMVEGRQDGVGRGDSWEKVLYIDEDTGCSDLELDLSNPRILYAGMWRAERKPWTLISGAQEGGVYKSTDGGETWQRILYRGETTGAVDLTIDPANPRVLIAALNHHVTYPWDEESGGPTSGLFKTTDGGDTWTDITRNPGMPGGLIGKIGISISPARSSRVYAFIEADAGEGGIYVSDDVHPPGR